MEFYIWIIVHYWIIYILWYQLEEIYQSKNEENIIEEARIRREKENLEIKKDVKTTFFW